jgi:hypothetical protein
MTGPARATGHGWLALVAVLILTMATTVCGKDATGPDDTPTPVGTWTLVSIDGEPLPARYPFLFPITFADVEALSGQLSISADGACSCSLTMRWTVGENVTTGVDASACTWTRDNNAMTLASFVFER